MAESAQANAALLRAGEIRADLVRLMTAAETISARIIAAQAEIDEVVSKFGVRVRWAGEHGTRLDIMGPDGQWQEGVDLTNLVEGLAGRTYIDAQVAAIIDDAPENRNTLGKLSNAIDQFVAEQDHGYVAFPFDQAVSEWIIRHDLNRYPLVVTVDTSGNEFKADVQYYGPNNLAIKMISPQAGTAFIY